MSERFEVIVIGGGAAGLAGALSLARARRRVLVLDGGQPRNAPADGVHVYPGREGTPPGELLAIGRGEVAAYGAEVRDAVVVRAVPDGAGFRVFLADGGELNADRLLLAVGLVDELPPVPGLAERFGRDVLHCPYCHGWEVRDTPIGVLGGDGMAAHKALLWRQWSADVTLFLHGGPEPTAEEFALLAARGVSVVEGAVTGIVVDGDRLSGVRVGDRVVGVAALAVSPRFVARTVPGLGLEPRPVEMNGHVLGSAIVADPMGATAVAGVWVAGNVTSPMDQVISAAAAGVRAGAAINADLVMAEARSAALKEVVGG